jgi:hypothetical protein
VCVRVCGVDVMLGGGDVWGGVMQAPVAVHYKESVLYVGVAPKSSPLLSSGEVAAIAVCGTLALVVRGRTRPRWLRTGAGVSG